MKNGPVSRFADFAKKCKEKKLRSFSSYLSLSKVLMKYGYDSDSIDSILLFEAQTYEISDWNKCFEHCMAKIIIRLCFYGILQPDNLEAMRNEYIIALLYTAIHIVMDKTNKELSIRLQYGIVDEKSKGHVNFAIKEAKDLVCTMKDKQHKVPVSFA
jgi:hypothetical protein